MKSFIIKLLAVFGIVAIVDIILECIAYKADEANKPTEHEKMCPYFVEPHETDSANGRVCPCEVVNLNNSEDKDK
jgi:hypothetical protein